MTSPETTAFQPDWRGDELCRLAQDAVFALQRIEQKQAEWETNQRWQINQIREELKAVSKTVAWCGVIFTVGALAYLKHAWPLW